MPVDPIEPRFLSDVDGCTARMVPAYVDWANKKFGLKVRLEDIVYHNNMGRSPALKDVDDYLRREFYPEEGENGGWGGAFLEFMRQPDVYTRYVEPERDSQRVIADIAKRIDAAFVTALMKRAPQHVPDKLNWIGTNYPKVQIITCPSEKKHWLSASFIVEDRWDTCERFRQTGTIALLHKQPWSEAPEGYGGCDWLGIGHIVHTYLDAWYVK